MKYKCGKCGRKGHNARSCSKKKKTIKRKTSKKTKKAKKKKKKKVAKKTARRTMSRSTKVGIWGKIVARYKSKSSDRTYAVRKKGSSYSCNCPGWTFKRKGKARSCRHTKMAKASGKRRKSKRRRRFCRH
jgi:hypothetical protein